MAESIIKETYNATGLPGATAGTRYVGATVAGAPLTGSFLVGDHTIDQTGAMWVCTTAGSPGTWKQTVLNNVTSPSYDQVLTTLNPVVWWKLSEPVGSNAISDLSNNRYAGSVNGGYTFGQTGPITGTPSDTGLAFNGTSGYAALASTSPLGAISNQLSVAIWFKTTTSSGGCLASYLDNNGWNYLYIGMNNNGTVTSTASAATVYQTITSTKSYNDGNWHFACATAIGSGQFALYIDGILISSTTLTTNFTFSTSTNYIELSIFYGSGYFNGSLAQYVLFNTALTNNQIAGLYATVANLPVTSYTPITENVAGKNFIINGGMDIWQRGTSFSNTSTGGALQYTTDRWGAYRGAGVSGTAVTQLTGTNVGLTGFNYAARVQRISGNTSTNQIIFTQSLESNNTYPLAGQTVTLSFYARCGANFSATASGFSVQLGLSAGGIDSNLYNGYASANYPTAFSGTLTTIWQRYSTTFTIPANTTQFGMQIFYVPTGTAGTNDYFDITGVQLEIGQVATPFSRAGGSIGGELLLCQRYFQHYGNGSASEYYGVGSNITTSYGMVSLPLKVKMRATPSVTYSAASTFNIVAGGGGSYVTPTSLSVGAVTVDTLLTEVLYSSLTVGAGNMLQDLGYGTSSVNVSAEL